MQVAMQQWCTTATDFWILITYINTSSYEYIDCKMTQTITYLFSQIPVVLGQLSTIRLIESFYTNPPSGTKWSEAEVGFN